MKLALNFSPTVAADPAWTAAAERVAGYLRAHGVAGTAEISRLTTDIIAIARARWRPGLEPMTLAMETMHAGMNAWFARLLPAGEPGDAELPVRGRMALAMGQVPARWPGSFMRDRVVPEDMARVMGEAGPGRPPEIKFSNMAPRAGVEPASAGSRYKWQWSYRWPFLRIVTGLMVVLSLLGATLAAGR